MNKPEKIFAKGIYFDKPKENAPDYVIGKLSFDVIKAVQFLKKYEKKNGYVNCDVKQSSTGKVYVELNTWTPKELNNEPRDVSKLEPEDTLQDNEMPNFDVEEETISPEDITF